MTTQTENHSPFLEQLDQLTATLAKENTPGWLQQFRQQGLSEFRQAGIPTTKHEEWKYTNLSDAIRQQYTLSPKADGRLPSDALKDYCSREDINIVFVNGVFNKDLSQVKNPQGVEILTLQDAVKSYPAVLQKLWHNYDRQKDSAFVALNTALAGQGVYIDVKEKAVAKQVIHIVHVTYSGAGHILTCPRTIIRLGKSSEASVLETHIAFDDEHVYLSVPLTDIYIEENATLFYTKAQKESLKAYHVGTTRIWQKRDSTFRGFSLIAGGLITRNNLDVVINGSGVTAYLDGLYSVYKNQHVDNHSSVDHREPNSVSNQLYKGVLNDASRAVFNGKIFVRPIAQKTNSYQLNKNLLLGKECRVDTKPQLEIFADDVKCTHGATIGQLHEDEIFYLQARGIPKKTATRLLTQGFVNDILDRLQNDSIREKVARMVKPTLEALEG